MQYSIGQTTMAARRRSPTCTTARCRAPPSRTGRNAVDDHDRARPEGLGTEGRPVRQGVARHHDPATTGRSSNTNAARWSGDEAVTNPGTTTDPRSVRPVPLADLAGDVPGWDLSGYPSRSGPPAANASTRCVTTSTSPLRWRDSRSTGGGACDDHHHQRCTARLRRARTGTRPGLADACWPGPSRRGTGATASARHAGRSARVPPPAGRDRAPGSGRLMRFETTGGRLAGGQAEILRWTPIIWTAELRRGRRARSGERTTVVDAPVGGHEPGRVALTRRSVRPAKPESTREHGGDTDHTDDERGGTGNTSATSPAASSNPATANDARRPGTASLPTMVSASAAVAERERRAQPHATCNAQSRRAHRGRQRGASSDRGLMA
jgi:hypothetical protein